MIGRLVIHKTQPIGRGPAGHGDYWFGRSAQVEVHEVLDLGVCDSRRLSSVPHQSRLHYRPAISHPEPQHREALAMRSLQLQPTPLSDHRRPTAGTSSGALTRHRESLVLKGCVATGLRALMHTCAANPVPGHFLLHPWAGPTWTSST